MGCTTARPLEESMVKVLILGSGESGKTTILKQLKILCGNGFSDEDRLFFKFLLRENTVDCMNALCKAVLDLGIKLDAESKQPAQAVLECPRYAPEIPLDIRTHIAALWKDPGIQLAFARRNEFHLIDSAPYFFTHLDRIFSPDFVPNEQDILRARKSTVGIVETSFFIENIPFRIYDVGGQRGERRKWIHCFEGVRAIMYIVSLSEYDQMLEEDKTRNRMEESLKVFEAVINLPWFRTTPIILFLNKNDLFAEKIQRVDLSIYFPAYTGGLEYENALTFIHDAYFSKNQAPEVKHIYTHVTDATDTQTISFVWKATKHIILERHLTDSGLIQ